MFGYPGVNGELALLYLVILTQAGLTGVEEELSLLDVCLHHTEDEISFP